MMKFIIKNVKKMHSFERTKTAIMSNFINKIMSVLVFLPLKNILF